MKKLKILILFFSPCLVGWGPAQRPQESANIYAVIVGVAKYQDGQIENLKYSEKDAADFYNLLRSPVCGSVPEENIALLTGAKATRANVIKELISKFSRARDNDMIIFYCSGHGKGGEYEDNGYLLSYDAQIGDEGATALSMDEVASKMQHSQAKMKVSYIDACHAALFKSKGKGLSTDENLAITNAYRTGLSTAGDGEVSFLASTAREESQEKDKLKNGVFTYYLIKGLLGDADRLHKDEPGYSNGIVTVGELSAYLKDKVRTETNATQNPQAYGTFDDNFPLSVVSPDVSIAREMAKMPVRKVKIRQVNYAGDPGDPSAPRFNMEDKKLKPDGTDIVFAYYDLINNFKEPLLMYKVYSVGGTLCSTLIAPGQMTRSIKIDVGNIMHDQMQVGVSECTMLFRTIDETKPILYGKLQLPVEPYVEKTFILSESSLYLSKDRP